MDWDWAVGGVTDEVPRTTGPECSDYMTNRRRWIEAILFTLIFLFIIRWAVKRLDPIVVPPSKDINKPHSAVRLLLLLAMTFVFGIELGFKFAGRSVIFVMNPCHIQTVVQIYLLASKPNKMTIALFRIQMNNLNGPFLAFLFPEVECRTLPFEQATYWIQHALLYIIPVYILKSGAYKVENINDYNWVAIGVMIMLLYHFVVLNALSIYTGINLNHMLCAAVADPFQGQHYRIAAVIHESILCPILNKMTVLLFSSSDPSETKEMPFDVRHIHKSNQTDEFTHSHDGSYMLYYQQQHLPVTSAVSPVAQLSLAAEIEMATAMDKFDATDGSASGLRRRYERAVEPTEGDAALDKEVNVRFQQEAEIANAITAEYSATMPTTKID